MLEVTRTNITVKIATPLSIFMVPSEFVCSPEPFNGDPLTTADRVKNNFPEQMIRLPPVVSAHGAPVALPRFVDSKWMIE